MISNVFLTRLRNGKLRQMAIAASAVVAAGIFVAYLPPSKIGAFAFYSITLLLLLNSVLALLQYYQVIKPIGGILAHLIDLSGHIAADDIDHIEYLALPSGDAFGCLSAAFDSIIESLLERAISARDLARNTEETLVALPIAVLLVTRNGKAVKILNASGLGDAFNGFRIGEKPLASYWGAGNLKMLDAALEKAFLGADTVWCDLKMPHKANGEGLFRAAYKRLNDMSALLTVVNLSDFRPAAPADGRSADGSGAQKHTALRRMAASIAHDSKNVFAALNNLVSVNRMSTDPNVVAQIPLAEDAIARGARLMDELTSFAGEVKLNLRCVPAAEGLRTVIESPSIRALLPPNVNLIVSVSDKRMPEIDLDTDQAWKVFGNLVKNAVEAMRGASGRIWIKVEPSTMTEETARSFRHTGPLRMGEGVLVTVTDDGPGIPEDLAEHIFEPYYSSKGDGRGIGLATVMTLVDAHAGAMAVKSSPGFGTTFYFYIPASRNTAEELKLVREIAPNGEILLVDDDPTILHTTSLVLRALKLAAHPSASEADALTKLRALRDRVRAVLVDGSLGCVSSAGLVRHIREEFPKIPVIIVSGAPREEIERCFTDVRYDGFLSKPYTVADLSGALKNLGILS